MEKTATFTITRKEKTDGWYYTLRCKAFKQFNRVDVPEKRLYQIMEDLSDVFNTVLNIAVVFEIG